LFKPVYILSTVDGSPRAQGNNLIIAGRAVITLPAANNYGDAVAVILATTGGGIS
jgi:hypothetical protein